jgi:hypothetical protein
MTCIRKQRQRILRPSDKGLNAYKEEVKGDTEIEQARLRREHCTDMVMMVVMMLVMMMFVMMF